MASGYLSCISSSFVTRYAASSQFTPFGSAVCAKMKDELPVGACSPLPLILILTHLNRILRLCLSIVGVHLILAFPLSHLPTRVQLCVNILALKWILFTIYSAFAPLRGCEVRKLSAVSVRVTRVLQIFFHHCRIPLVMTCTIAFPKFRHPGYRMIYEQIPQPPTSSSPPYFRRLHVNGCWLTFVLSS